VLRLRTLGGLSLEGPDGPLTGPAVQRHRLALLALLAVAGQRGLSRDRILAYLWPETDAERASHTLAQTLYALRRLLGLPELTLGSAEIRLNPAAIASDIAEFEEALARGEFERAVALYGGHFLEGFHLHAVPAFERWMDEVRTSCLRRLEGALTSLAEVARTRGDTRAAVEWWRRLAALSPLSTWTAVGLMGALVAAGDRAGALRHARIHEALLRQELDVEADPEVLSLALRLREQPGEDSATPPMEEPLPSPAFAPHDSASATGVEEFNEAAVPGTASAVPVWRWQRHIVRIGVLAAAPGAILLALLVAWGLPEEVGGGSRAQPLSATALREESPSLAVLPLVNFSRDTLDSYLASALAEEIASRLGQFGRLRVKSPRATRMVEAGGTASLGVDYLIEGSTHRIGPTFRLRVRLTRAMDEFVIWDGSYRASDDDLVEVQERIAREVATQVVERLLPAEERGLTPRTTSDPRAFTHLLRGNVHLMRRTPESVLRAIQEYRAASRLDPGFTDALAREAYAYGLFLDWGWTHPDATAEELLARGLLLTEKILEYDSVSADAWMSRAYLLVHRDPLRLRGSVEAFQRSVALDPDNAEVLHQLGQSLMVLGRMHDAREAYRHALRLEPERAMTLVPLAAMSWKEGRIGEALQLADSAVAADPTAPYAYTLRGLIRLHLRDAAGARSDAETALRIDDSYSIPARSVLARALYALGDTVAAREELKATTASLADPVRPTQTEARFLSAALLALGERPAALELLEHARPRGAWLWFYLQAPDFHGIRNDQRFRRIIEETRPLR
jgi:DNA-binding SARP family transcriptional activator/TolB-like protein